MNRTMKQRRRGSARTRRGALAAIAAAIAATAAIAPAAHAGSYPMYACDVPGINLPVPSRGAWIDFDTSGQVQHFENCTTKSGRGGSVWFQINYPTGFIGQQGGIGEELTIPAGWNVTINRVTDWTETALTAQGPNQPPAWGPNLAPAIAVPPGGSASGFDGTGTSGTGHDSGTLAAGTKQYQLGVFCPFYGGGYGNCTWPTPFLRIRGIKTTLQESVDPAASIDGGTLTAAGPLKGTKTLSFSASDGDSGVEKVEALLDDVVVGTDSNARDLTQPVAQQTGACSYTGIRACPASESHVVSADTNRVADGAYQLSLRVTDAAGNTHTLLAPDPVVVDNHPAPINTELPAITGDATEDQILSDYDGIWQHAVGAATYRW